MVIIRKLPPAFINDLNEENGTLHPLLEQVKKDNTLLLSVRDGYVNIYYRGGNILRVSLNANGTYKFFFDEEYNKYGVNIPKLQKTVKKQSEASEWITALPCLRGVMDSYFSNHNKSEREFQQLIARENNYSSISNETEYFITDIEFNDTSIGARFDLLAIRWLASERKNGSKCRAALIEMKYGDGALEGDAGILKHLHDFESIILDAKRYQSLQETMQSQFSQLDQLGLLQFKHSTKGFRIELNNPPEVIFVLANHNPRSTKLTAILDDPRLIEYAKSPHFDLRFFVASFAGYGFHSDCMLTLPEFRHHLSEQQAHSKSP